MRLHPAVMVWALGAFSTILVTVLVLQFDVPLPLWVGIVCVLVTASSPIVWFAVEARRVLDSSAVLAQARRARRSRSGWAVASA